MRVCQYSVILDESGKNVLVRDFAKNYAMYDRLDNPDKIAQLMRDMFQFHIRAEEYIYLICLNTKGRPIGFFETAHGTCKTAVISPREILVRALLCGASGITIVHNHPSGDPAPSQPDNIMTERVQRATDIIGISFCDHIIIGGCTYYSYMQDGKLKPSDTDV